CAGKEGLMHTMRGRPPSRRLGRPGLLAGCLAASFSPLVLPEVARADADGITPQITVDQFGWLPRSRKVAVFAQAVRGQNARVAYRPGRTFEVRRQADGSVAYRGNLKPWNQGKVSELAGDRVWHADFSDVRAPGAYYLDDPANRARSFTFGI